MKNIRVWMIIIGIVLAFHFSREFRLALKSSGTPQKLTCQELIEHGPGGNLYITLTDYYPCSSWYIYETKNRKNKSSNNDWPYTKLYMPAMSTSSEWFKTAYYLSQEDEKAQLPTPTNIRVLLKFTNVKTPESLDALLDTDTLSGMVINSVESLSRDEIRLLKKGYPTLVASKCYVVEVGKTPTSVIFAGTGTLVGILLIGGGIIWMVRTKKKTDIPAIPSITSDGMPKDIPAASRPLYAAYGTQSTTDTTLNPSHSNWLDFFLQNNQMALLADDSGNKITDDTDLVNAIVDGRISYKAFQKFAGNTVTAAQFYADKLPEMYDYSSDNSCSICHESGRKFSLDWGAKIQTDIKRNIFESILAIPFLIITFTVGGIAFIPGQSVTNIKFTTYHTLCRKCKPSFMRDMLAAIFSIFSFILLLVFVAIMVTIAVFAIMAFCEKPNPSYFSGIILTIVSVAMIGALCYGWRLYHRIEIIIRVPKYFRKIEKGPFRLLKVVKLK